MSLIDVSTPIDRAGWHCTGHRSLKDDGAATNAMLMGNHEVIAHEQMRSIFKEAHSSGVPEVIRRA
jgi:hypothetical protein